MSNEPTNQDRTWAEYWSTVGTYFADPVKVFTTVAGGETKDENMTADAVVGVVQAPVHAGKAAGQAAVDALGEAVGDVGKEAAKGTISQLSVPLVLATIAVGGGYLYSRRGRKPGRGR